MRKMIKRLRTMLCSLKYRKNCRADSTSYLNRKCSFEGENRIGSETLFYSSSIGFGSYIGNNGLFTRVKIGRYCSIGNGVKLVNITHPLNGISTHPAFYSSEYGGISYVEKEKLKEYLSTESGWHCEIGNDVWIGNEVLLRGGIKIGDGAVIGMGAVVTKDVPPYAIVGGVPARIIRYRFAEEKIASLMELKWWDRDETWIRDNANLFMNPDLLFEKEKHESM